MSYTLEQLKLAFNAGKQFKSFENWAFPGDQNQKSEILDPRILIERICDIGGQISRRYSDNSVLINLRSRDAGIIHNFLSSECFLLQKNDGSSSLNEDRYISSKYFGMTVYFDPFSRYITVKHDIPIDKDQEIRNTKINDLVK